MENETTSLERLCDNISSLLVREDWRYQLLEARKQIPDSGLGGPAVPLAEIMTASRSGKIIESITKLNQLTQQGYLQSAMEEAYHALQFAPTYLPLHTIMGDILLKQDRQVDAIIKFNIVAQAYSVRGEVQRAVDLYQKVVTLSSMDLEARSHLINQLTILGKTDEALIQYMDFAEAYFNLADLDMVRKTYTDALRLAQQPKVDRAWRIKILHRMADIAMQSLDWRQAIRMYEQIRTVQPDDETARAHLVELNFRLGQEQQAVSELDNFIAYLLGKNEQNKAITFVASLVREYTDRPVVRRRLAELYQQAGRIRDAVDQLDSAGEALLHSGDRAGAIQMVELILALKPENASSYEKLLAQLKSGKV
jgi:tetratricopeptide (TPR) repeat protein